MAAERGWLDDLALYQTLRESHGGWGWTTWPAAERDRADAALASTRANGARRALEVAYVQWTLNGQWEQARARMRELGVELMGDLPFVVCAESADVWSHAGQFQLHLSLGAPPDAYAADGQDWGLPPYDWLAMESDDLAWIRARTRRASRLYDRFRLDHVVGYFRQWVKNKDGQTRGRFDPDSPDAQGARGRRVLGAILDELSREPGVAPPRALAEDLGVIPPFARDVLRELSLPGYRVLPWEKDDGRFRDPREFPAESIASYSTHDTAPIVSWWNELPQHDREVMAARAGIAPDEPEPGRTLALLRDLYASRSGLALTLAQELLGLPDRINTPATVGGHNWCFRLPAPIEELQADAAVVARFDTIRQAVASSGR
jgi:4-alpha-glucanotransferase